MTTTRADQFTSALLAFEDDHDTAAMTALFTADAELLRPETDHPRRQDPDDFWQAYLSPFSSVSTEFTRVDEAGDLAALEWESRGELTTGRPITYRGVSLLRFAEDGAISRFATYFDTAAFGQPTDATTGDAR